MHIPDGFLNIATVTTTYAVSAGGLANAIRLANRKLGEKHIPMMGILAAFIFAAPMLNFPVAAGTSGHLIGAALAVILLGPWAAVIIMSAVLIAQSLIFQDGGLLALGANIFNMGIVASFTAYLVYRLGGGSRVASVKRKLVAGFAAAWASVFAASIAASIELAVSGTAPLTTVLFSMAGIHSLIGIGEGAITVTILSLVYQSRTDLVKIPQI